MPAFDTESWEPLEKSVKMLWRAQQAIGSIFFGLILLLPEFILSREVPKWPIPFGLISGTIFLLYLGIGQLFIGKKFESFRFQLGDDDLSVASGIFWKQWRFISRNRVQHVDITAGPIARALGIVQVSIFVGGMAAAAATIPGLTQSRGEELRHKLVKDRKPQILPPEEPPVPPPVAPPSYSGESPVE